MKSIIVPLFVIIFSLFPFSLVQADVQYTITDIGTFGGTSSRANGINNRGQVVGYAYTSGDATYHAFRTAANQPINPATDDLGTLGGTESAAYAINDIGQVVG